MGTIGQKIDYLKQTKTLLRAAITNAGGTITDSTPFGEYPSIAGAILGDTISSVSTSLTSWDGKFDYLEKTKEQFRTLLTSHGETVTDTTPFRQYVAKLENILPNANIIVGEDLTGKILFIDLFNGGTSYNHNISDQLNVWCPLDFSGGGAPSDSEKIYIKGSTGTIEVCNDHTAGFHIRVLNSSGDRVFNFMVSSPVGREIDRECDGDLIGIVQSVDTTCPLYDLTKVI